MTKYIKCALLTTDSQIEIILLIVALLQGNLDMRIHPNHIVFAGIAIVVLFGLLLPNDKPTQTNIQQENEKHLTVSKKNDVLFCRYKDNTSAILVINQDVDKTDKIIGYWVTKHQVRLAEATPIETIASTCVELYGITPANAAIGEMFLKGKRIGDPQS